MKILMWKDVINVQSMWRSEEMKMSSANRRKLKAENRKRGAALAAAKKAGNDQYLLMCENNQ